MSNTADVVLSRPQAVVVKSGTSYFVELQPKGYQLEWSGQGGAVSAEQARLNANSANDNAVAAALSAVEAAASASESADSAALADADKVAADLAATTAAAAEAAILAALGGSSITSLAMVATDRTVLAALNTTVPFPTILTEGKRGGVFQLVDYATYSALVTADTQQGIFVRSTYNPAKVWARTEFLTSMVMHLLWFGAQFDGSFNDWPAMAGALAIAGALPQISTADFAYFTASPEIRLPYGHGRFYGNSCVLNDTVTIIGSSTGLASGLPTMIEWDDGVSFFDCNAPGCRVEGVAVAGGFSGVEGEFHAFTGTRAIALRNIYGIRISGDGIHFDSNPGGSNFDGVQVESVFFENCRTAVYLDGPDSNVECFKGVQGKSCRRWGLWDSSFLGNTHIGHQYANCGVTPYNDGINIPASMVSYSGNQYFVIAGWGSWCSVNAPSGTTSDNSGWAFYAAGGATTGVPAWFNGILARDGGPVLTDSANAPNQIIGCYAEGGQPYAQIQAPSIVQGGILAGWVWSKSTGVVFSSGPGLNAAMFSTAVREHSYVGTDEDFYCMLGGPNSGLKTILYASGSVTLPGVYRLIVQGNDIVSNYGNGAGIHYTITGPNTTQKFGRVANQPHIFNPDTLAIGSGVNARVIAMSDGIPGGSDIAPGEVRFRVNPAVSGNASSAGWIRTTTGIWRQFGSVAASPGAESYIAPSGGTTVDSQCRNALAQVRNDLANLRDVLQAAQMVLP